MSVIMMVMAVAVAVTVIVVCPISVLFMMGCGRGCKGGLMLCGGVGGGIHV